MIPYEDMIDCESWYRLADYHYTHETTDMPTGIVHCDMAAIPQCFEHIAKYPSRKYIVISSRCDFGLHYQEHYPPWHDYYKMARQLSTPADTKNGYADITLPAPVNKERCNEHHRYSIKCYRYTEATFPYIPKNVVKWFLTNNTVFDDERLVNIPFGINGVDGSTHGREIIAAKANWQAVRTKDLYVNFAFYTADRLELYNLYNNADFATVERDVDYDRYVEQLSIHNFVLCPPGNGWDCYRTLEALYMGCIPIVERNTAMFFYSQLNVPMIFLPHLSAVTKPLLHFFNVPLLMDRTNWDLSKVALPYWKDLITQSRSLLL